MLLRRKITFAAATIATCIAALYCVALSGVLTPEPPKGLQLVHLGDSPIVVCKKIGIENNYYSNEKGTLAYRIKGTFADYVIFIGFAAGERVNFVKEGTWLRGIGWFHPRVESGSQLHNQPPE